MLLTARITEVQPSGTHGRLTEGGEAPRSKRISKSMPLLQPRRVSLVSSAAADTVNGPRGPPHASYRADRSRNRRVVRLAHQ